MGRILLLLFIVTLQQNAGSIDPNHPPLFAKVINVEEDDVLNVRERPDHKSKKVGTQVPSFLSLVDTRMGVERCERMKTSVWCKVYQIAQNFYSEDFSPGWVNADYLKPENIGYVLIDRVGNCDYALGCHNEICEIVTGYKMDTMNNVTALNRMMIKRDRLYGESSFGAMNQERDGLCTTRRFVEDYLASNKLEEFSKKYHEDAYLNAQSFLKHLVTMDDTGLEAHFDPLLGVVMTEMVSFADQNKLHFMRKDINNIWKNRKNIIHWGVTYSKGDDIRMSLYDYMKQLTKPLFKLTEVKKLDSKLRGFEHISGVQLVGYEFIWRDKGTKLEDYTWLGLVIIMGKKKATEEWYVVGILRDRWTI